MIRTRRIRKLTAPTGALYKALAMLVLGLFALIIGLVLACQAEVRTFLIWASGTTRRSLNSLVPPESVSQVIYNTGWILILLGLYCSYRAIRAAVNDVVETLNPGLKSGKVDVYVRRQQLAHGPRIVAMGGGTGLSTLLRGLKQHSSNITAIVTVTDDGGSSGRLTREKGMIPPGDIRNCLVALADAEKAMTDLFQHRFRDDSGSLSGHSMGNLLIAALVDQAKGDFEKAIEIASDVLAIRGRVVPSTLDHVRLRAELEGGVEICGETAIVEAGRRIRKLHLDPSDCTAYRGAIEAIKSADLIIIGPGSVYTSIIPNLLVPGVMEALQAAEAPKIYICNVMTQPGESDSFTASEHAAAIVQQVGNRTFDYVMVNTGIPSESALEKYRHSNQHLVDADLDRIRAMGYRVLQGNFMSETDFVRHDPMKVVSRLIAFMG